MARRRRVAALGALLLAIGAGGARPAAAFVPGGNRITAASLTALPAAGVKAPLRDHVTVRYDARPGPAWSRLVAALGGRWQASWDAATGVPSRIWGEGLAAPGTTSPTTASADAATRLAWSMLGDHLALLAPGATLADFALVSDDFDGAIRSVGFVQRAGGRRVVGGQVSFRFKHERLVAIGSEALPNVIAPARGPGRAAPARLRTRAEAAVTAALGVARATAGAPGDEVVLPLVGDAAVLGYRAAIPVRVDAGAEGQILAYADPATGEILAVHQQALFTTGALLYRGIDRNPMRPRIDRPAPRAHIFLDGVATTTGPDGALPPGGGGNQSVITAVVGDLVAVVNKAASGALATANLTLPAGGQVVWDASASPEDDAQVQTYLSLNRVKAYVRTFAPDLTILDEQTTANVNIAQDCNAFFDGTAVNFFHASAQCQNTGLLEDVVFHEFGHDVHAHEIIDGVGAFDGAMSEGAADFLAAMLTGDHGMGRGFFYNDKALRDLDPPDGEHIWPRDIGEIHFTGMIFGGTFWDLRTALIASLGEGPGIALTQRLFVGALRRSVSIPTSLIEVLIEDDDDGNLANGTPHECEIRRTFGAHGMRTATGHVDAPGALAVPALATTIGVRLEGLAPQCGGDVISDVTLDWKGATGDAPPPTGNVAAEATPFADATYHATLPLPTNGGLMYRATVHFTDGGTMVLADNLGDPYYEVYEGDTVPLYCTDFEARDPFAEGWTTGTSNGAVSPWAWGAAGGGATDPSAAYSGTKILAQGLGKDYMPNSGSWVKLPPIDTGVYSDVRLQFRRWLGVEDSHYDQAKITVNGVEAWRNATANMGDASSLHTLDREWRFVDVPISDFSPARILEVGLELTSDGGLEFGGWQLDDVCVVARIGSRCGDGKISGREQCDDGVRNANTPDACRPNCTLRRCGDGVVDTLEECDGGPGGDATCSAQCTLKPVTASSGCAAGGGPGPAGALVPLALLGLAWLGRRATQRA